MSTGPGKYDEVLSTILVDQKSIIGFLSTVFDFLARRTDFYYVPKGAYENMGFPPGVAEELTVKVLRNCDPQRPRRTPAASDHASLDDDIMCSTVAQEVEVEAESDEDDPTETEQRDDGDTNEGTVLSADPSTASSHSAAEPDSIPATSSQAPPSAEESPKPAPSATEPCLPPAQRNSEAYNGAVRENYSWAQTIMDLDVTIRLPPEVKSSKDVRVNISSTELCVECVRSKETVLKGTLIFKVKAQDTFWSFSEGRLLIHLEKLQERWWNALLSSEEPIDLSKIDCSRPLDELPEEHVAKVRELQWNHERKLQGLPTSDELRNLEVLRRAWDADGSPFKGKPFDPNVLRR